LKKAQSEQRRDTQYIIDVLPHKKRRLGLEDELNAVVAPHDAKHQIINQARRLYDITQNRVMIGMVDLIAPMAADVNAPDINADLVESVAAMECILQGEVRNQLWRSINAIRDRALYLVMYRHKKRLSEIESRLTAANRSEETALHTVMQQPHMRKINETIMTSQESLKVFTRLLEDIKSRDESESARMCRVCMFAMLGASDTIMMVTQCGHMLCKPCLDTCRANPSTDNCPVCRDGTLDNANRLY